MRNMTFLLAAAPLALLAACGEPETEDTAALETDTAASTQSADDTRSDHATDLDEAGDFSGTYSFDAPDGTRTQLTVNAQDDTFEYKGADGTLESGNYDRLADGYRIKIEDWFGSPAYFTVSDGDLVRLEQDIDITPDMQVSGERYVRGDDEDDAVFSREPELASPVAPQD